MTTHCSARAPRLAMTTRTFRRLPLLLAALAALLPAAAWADPPASRVLAREDITVYGLGLKVEPARQVVPRDIATIVSVFLQAPTDPGAVPPFADDAEVRATLRGPSLAGPLELVTRPNTPFQIPALKIAGVHTLENIRLVSGGEVLLYGSPEQVEIEVIDKLLVTQITARPLTADEIRERGIVFDRSNFQAYNFTAAFAVADGPAIPISFPVVLPTLGGPADASDPTATLGTIATQAQLRDLKTIIPDTLRIQTQVPNLRVVGFTLQAPKAQQGQQLVVPPIPGVVVIPGDIGFLNQFFSVLLMVGNVAPAGSNLVVRDLSATILLPSGNDEVAGTPDDPLAMARTALGETPRIRAVTQPGPDGTLGTADDITTIAPGETGNAEFLVEGRREGSHVVEMAIEATLEGLPVGPVPIQGRAAGMVNVRNPRFTLTFTHPEIVNAGEPYTLDVTVTNTSESPANFVSLNLYPRHVSGARLVGESTQNIDFIAPQDSATVSFSLISALTGRVTAATLDGDGNVAGRFAFKTAVGELGIPLSPESLVLPAEAAGLPKELRDAALGLLGRAWALATAPPAAVPKDLSRFSKQLVIDRAIDLAEAGLRVSLGEPLPDAVGTLWFDFAGSDYARIGESLQLPRDAELKGLIERDYQGFDLLRRKSVRGDVLAGAFASVFSSRLGEAGPVAFHQALAEQATSRASHVSVLVSGQAGGATPVDLVLVDPAGATLGGQERADKLAKAIAFGEIAPLRNAAGDVAAHLATIATPQAPEYVVRLVRRADASPTARYTLSLVVPTAGGLRRVVFENVTLDEVPAVDFPADAPVKLRVERVDGEAPVSGSSPAPAADAAVVDPPPAVLGVRQVAAADLVGCGEDGIQVPAGRVVAVLFSEEVTPESVQDRLPAAEITAFAPEGNRAVSVALQPSRRVAYVALRDPFGPFVPRTMTVTGAADRTGRAVAGQGLPMQATVSELAGVLSGRVLTAEGKPVADARVRLLYEFNCGEGGGTVGISEQTSDAEGRFGWDYVPIGPSAVKLVAFDPETDLPRIVRVNVTRAAQRLNVDVVFIGRGTVRGRTLDESGAPLALTAVRVTSLTDNAQFGATTDATGSFVIPRVPVGNVLIEAVNTTARAQTAVSELVPFAGAIVTRDLTLFGRRTPEGVTIKYGAATGRVLRDVTLAIAPGVTVYAYYQNRSQAGVRCPPSASGEPPECAVAAAVSGEDGAFRFDELPAGEYRMTAIDQGGLSQGETRLLLPADATRELNVVLVGGLGTVRGTVVDADGAPVPGARVGGGMSLVVADDQGEFTLPDVPVGRRTIVAVSDALGARGSATIDVTRPGEIVDVRIVLPSLGRITGVVYAPDGVTKVGGITVFAFRQQAGGIEVAGEAVTDANGGFVIDDLPIDRWTLSAFRPDFSEGNFANATLRYNGESLRQDIRFRGAGGRVRGSVSAADGVTRLAARVGISGDRLVIAGGRVAIRFEFVQNYQIVDTNPQTGEFAFNGLLVGPFTLRALGQFSPDPITFESQIATPNQEVRVDLRLQPTSVITGVLYMPDGATPAPANVQVKFKSNAVKVFCSEGAGGESECTSVPQGIQEEVVVTNDRGEFVFPLVNAGPFTLTADEAATGRTGELRGTVRAGERLGVTMRLVGLGTIAVAVKGSDATTPIPGARVEVRQSRFPYKAQTFTAGPDGLVSFPNFTEGEFVVSAIDLRNGAQGRAPGAITADGQTASVNVFLFDQSGSVEGTVLKADGTPAANTQVVLSRNGQLLGFTLTDAQGAFGETGLPLGPIEAEAFEPTTGARGRFTGSIDVNGQVLAANFRLDALGLLRGTLVEARTLAPLKNWRVQLSQATPSGRSLPLLVTTTGVDGSFSFPGASVGTFRLSASNPDVVGQASASGAIARAGQLVDVTLLATINRAVFGRVSGIVTLANGQPSTTAVVTLRPSAGAVRSTSVQGDGGFAFDDVPLGRFTVDAVAQGTGGAGRAVSEVLFENEDAQVLIALGGVGTLSGRVFASDGVTPKAGAQVTLSGTPALGCSPCTVFSGPDGGFTFADTPVRVFTITAEDTVTGLKGSVSDVLAGGQSRGDLRVVLQPTASVSGRVLTAGGAAASGIVANLTSGSRQLFVETAADGSFSFGAVPLGGFTLSLQDPIGPGLARRSGTLATPVDFGDIVLDETPPAVASTTPGAGATGVARGATITVAFSEVVDLGTVNAQALTLSSATGPVTGVTTPAADERTFTFEPLSDLAAETRYTIRVEGVKDRMGRVMAAPFSASFVTEDVTPPTLVEATPPANATGVTSFTVIRLKFSEPIDPARYAGDPIVLRAGTTALEGTTAYLFGNTVIVFTPARPLADETLYQVQLAQTFDTAGNALPAQSFTFQTTDRTPPVITALTPVGGNTVIEGTVKQIAAEVGTTDVAVVDYYVNDVPIAAVRTVPFTFAFNALPQFGTPGAQVKISALATDTSGNRATSFVSTFVTVTPDQAPAVTITAPAAGASVPNGQRVNVSVRATDDVGVTELAYRAGTGNAADAAVRAVTPAATERVEAFGFDVPANAAPGSTITIEATARDGKGQVVAAAPVSISVLDAAAPTVSITGATSGERVRPGQTVSAIVVAEDAGRIREIGFTASGVASLNQVRTIDPALASVATSFTFTVAEFAGPSDRVFLDAYAIDVAGNRRDAGRVTLSIADNVAPAVTLTTASGRPDMTPGRQVVVVAEANDETGVSRITLTGRGAFTVSDAKSISPPITSASASFTIDVPASVPDGATLQLEARAIDLSGNVSSPVALTLTARPLSDVTLPLSTVLLAGERKTLTLSLGNPAPAGGLRVDLSASTANVIVTPFVLFAAGETDRTFDVDGVTGGTSAISASIAGVERATMTATVQGGVVRGRVVSETFDPVGGAQVTVVGGNTLTTTTAADGTFLVQGLTASFATVRVLDGATSRIGFAQGSLNAPGGFLHLADIPLIAGGTITGRVERPTPPGTPAGAGVQVQLFKRNGTSVGEIVATAFTDAQSAFTFALVGLGDYFIEAFEAGTGHRGRAATAIAASGAEVDVTVTFLARGRVEGTVTTAGGAPVDNAEVKLSATSIFGGAPQRTTQTADGGKYRFDDVFAGQVSVSAHDAVSNTSGGASGEIASDGQVLTLDVGLQAVGSITGQVTRFGGAPVGPGIAVSLRFTGRSTTTDAQGRYRLDFVPLGTYTVLASEASTGSRGSATATLGANGAEVVANVTFLGKGTVVVTVNDANGQPVQGASVTISQADSADASSGSTDVNGQVVFSQVNEGTYTATASANGLSGAVGGIVVTPGQQSAATVTLEPTGTIAGTVFLPNGSTPATSGTVILQNAYSPFLNRTVTLTAADNGAFSFTNVKMGAWNLLVNDANGRRRAVARNVTLTSNGQQESRTLTYVGLGTVTGTVSNPPPGGGAAGVPVTVQSLTPEFGGSYGATTNAAGGYSVANVPVGDVIVTASNGALQLLGEATGRITADGQSITVDVVLQSSAVSLPLSTSLQDAYAQTWTMQRNGSVTGGTGSVFNAGAMVLDVVRDGTPTRFTGSQVGVYEDGRREIAVTQNGIAGINVTRKLYVPANGYFGRWVELLSNPSSEPITVDVRVSAQLSNFYFTGTLRPVATSSGDTTLDAGDLWAVIDDSNPADPYVSSNFPPIAFVMGGPGAAVGVGSASLTTSNNLVTYEWRQVTVPAGGRVALMHFVAQQTSTAAGAASGERLSGLAPEALGALSTLEAQQTANFVVPPDLSSAIEPLPPFGGSIAGLVYEGDGTTRTPGSASVRFKSDVAVFSREIVQFSNPPTSAFSFAEIAGRPIPLAPGSLRAVHPDSGVVSEWAPVALSPAAPSATQNVVFTGTAIVEVRTERLDGSTVPGGQLTSGSVRVMAALPGGGSYSKLKNFGAQGLTEFFGVPLPGSTNRYDLESSAQHAQGTGFVAYGTLAGPVANARNRGTVTYDGATIRGRILLASGAPYAGAAVRLTNSTNLGQVSTFERTATTDVNGDFVSADVRIDGITVAATYNGLTISAPRIFTAPGQTYTTNLQFPLNGTITVTTRRTNGAVVGGTVFLQRPDGSTASLAIPTSGANAGKVSFTGLTAGNYTVYADALSLVALRAPSQVITIDTDGQVATPTLVFPPFGTLTGVFKSPSAAGTLRPNSCSMQWKAGDGAFSTLCSASTTATWRIDSAPLNQPVTVRAFYPGDLNGPAYIDYALGQLTADGETITRDILHPARATVRVTVTDASSQPMRVFVHSKYRYDSWFTYRGTTNVNGQLDLFSVPEGNFEVELYDANTSAKLATRTGTVAPADDGSIAPFNVQLILYTGTVSGVARVADGITPVAPWTVIVEARRADTLDVLGSQYVSSADGSFSLSGIAAPPEGVVVRAYWANDESVRDEETVAFTAGGQTRTVALDVPIAWARVEGTVRTTSGTPLRNVYVRAVGPPPNYWDVLPGTYTDDAGAFAYAEDWYPVPGMRFAVELPGLPMTVAEAPNVDGVVRADIVVDALAVDVSGRVQAGDGSVGVPEAQVRVFVAGQGGPEAQPLANVQTDEEGEFQMQLIAPAGDVDFVATFTPDGETTFTNTVTRAITPDSTTEDVPILLDMPVVHGTVYLDAARTLPAQNPNVFVEVADGRSYYSRVISGGRYRAFAVPEGTFSVRARSDSGLEGLVQDAGTITSPNDAVLVDVVLPPSNDVTVTVLDGGVPAAADVALTFASGESAQTLTNGSGAGVVNFVGVGAGPAELQVKYRASGRLLRKAVEIAERDGSGTPQAITVDIADEPRVDVRVVLMAPNGAPAAGDVTVEALGAAGLLGQEVRTVTADANGAAVVAGLPPGRMVVSGRTNAGAYGKVLVDPPGPEGADVELVTGNAVGLPASFTSMAGVSYRVDTRGRIDSASNAGSIFFRRLGDIYVDAGFCCAEVAGVETTAGGEQWTIGPTPISGVELTRKIFRSTTSSEVGRDFVRFFDVITNTSTTARRLFVILSSSYPFLSYTQQAEAVEIGQVPRWGVTQTSSGVSSVLGELLGGGTVFPVAGWVDTGGPVNSYQVTLQPGESAAFLRFAVVRPSNQFTMTVDDVTSVQAAPPADLLDGLTTFERSLIRNWSGLP